MGEYFTAKIFLDSLACAKIKCVKIHTHVRNINDKSCLSENIIYLKCKKLYCTK